jgi:hypothetical protein
MLLNEHVMLCLFLVICLLSSAVHGTDLPFYSSRGCHCTGFRMVESCPATMLE